MGIFGRFFKSKIDRMKEKGDVKGLILLLTTNNQKAAISALGDIGDDAIDPLINAARNVDEYLPQSFNSSFEYVCAKSQLQGGIETALQRIGKPAYEPLLMVLEDNNDFVRHCASSVLGCIGNTHAIEPLKRRLNDEDELVRSSARTALEKLGSATPIKAEQEESGTSDESKKHEDNSGYIKDEDIMFEVLELVDFTKKKSSLNDKEKIQVLKKSSFNFWKKVESNPSCGVAHFGLGIMASMLNDWDDAIKEFELALQDDSSEWYRAYEEIAQKFLIDARREKVHSSMKESVESEMKFRMFKMAYDKEKKEKVSSEKISDKSFSEKDNMGTRQDTMDHAVAYWMARNAGQKFEPYALYIFDRESDAREALLELDCIHSAEDTGNLICTETLTFGYYRRDDGKYEAIVCGEDMTHELWAAAKDSFARHGGQRRNDQEPKKQSPVTSETKKAEPDKVTFVREDHKQVMEEDTIYRIHKGPDAASAKAFLEQNPVTRKFYHIVVETPEGNYCRDIQRIYKE